MKRKSVAALCLAGCMVTASLTGCGTGSLTKNVAEAVAEQQGNEDKVVEKDVQEKSNDIKDKAEKDKDIEDKEDKGEEDKDEDKDKEDKDEEDKDEEDKDKEDKDEEDKDEEDKDDKDKDDKDKDDKDKDDKDKDDKDDKDKDKDKDEDDKKDSKKSTSNKGLGEKYVDFDNIVFDINGKVYQLGKTTLAEMIEDGVPFDENDIADAQNTIKSNYKSQNIGIKLGEHYNTFVSVGNYTDNNKTIAECPIVKLYFPVDLEKEQDIITLPFSLDLTEDELTENAGEPTKFDTYESKDSDEDDTEYIKHTYEYETESEKYLLGGSYRFEFLNGELEYIIINWVP